MLQMAPVTAISRQSEGDRAFVVRHGSGEVSTARCLLMATGAAKPNIPSGVEGIELAEGYEVHDIDPDRFLNKRRIGFSIKGDV